MEKHGLEQMIEELKARGVKAGEEAAERLVEEAKERAKSIVAEALAQAETHKEQALAQKKRTMAALTVEMAQAARVGLTAFREAIEKSFLVPQVDEGLSALLARPAFLENAVLEMVKGFVASGMSAADVEVTLPEAQRQELAAFFTGKLQERGAAGVTVRFDDAVSFGFRIGPKDEGFSFDLTDEGFREILVRFLSPRFREAFYKP